MLTPFTGHSVFVRSGYTSVTPSEFSISSELTIEEMRKYAVEYMDHCIALGDLVLPYNPIGGPVQIETLG